MINKKVQKIYIKTDYGKHLCFFEPDEKKGFIVTAENLSGVITWGKNLAHAKKMVKEAIELCIECCVESKLHKRKKENKILVPC